MKPKLSSEEATNLRRRLLYARWLYEKGVVESEHHDELNHMLAIMHFHNAVEIVLVNTLLSHRWAISGKLRTLKYEQMIDEVTTGALAIDPKVSFPARLEVIRLAEIRNNVMHYGAQFHSNETKWARGVCRQFLREAIRDFFDEDIDTMVMSDLVENEYVRRLLQEASKQTQAGQYEKSLALCALVVNLAEESVSFVWQRRHEAFEDHLRFMLSPRDVNSHKLYDTLQMFAERIGEVENRSILFSLGIDMDAAHRFLSYEVIVHDITAVNERKRSYRFSKPRGCSLSMEDGEFGVRFATDLALKVQSLGLHKYMTRRFLYHEPHSMGDWESILIDVPDEIIDSEPSPTE